MPTETVFDYYGDESSQLLPRQLITGEQFKKLSMRSYLLVHSAMCFRRLRGQNAVGWPLQSNPKFSPTIARSPKPPQNFSPTDPSHLSLLRKP